MIEKLPQQVNPGRAQLITQWIALIALLAPLVTGMVGNQMVSPRLYGLGVAGLAVLAFVLSAPLWRAGVAWLRSAHLRRIIRRRYGAATVGLCRELKTLGDRGHAFSVGCVFSKQNDKGQQLLGIPLVQVCNVNLRLLLERMDVLIKDASSKPVTVLLGVYSWLDSYLQIYDTVRSEMQCLLAGDACTPAVVKSIQHDWEEVQQRISEMRTRYLKLAHEVNGIDSAMGIPEYLRTANGL
jgi:hypothetical protein